MDIRNVRLACTVFALCFTVAVGAFGPTAPAMAQAALTKQQSDALDTYNAAVKSFEAILASAARRSRRSSCRTCRGRRSTSPATP